jgi:hypothetical protein
MDGGENEKQERHRIKSAVKTNFKQQKKLRAHQLRGHKQKTRRHAKPAAEGLQLGGNAQCKYQVIMFTNSYLSQ